MLGYLAAGAIVVVLGALWARGGVGSGGGGQPRALPAGATPAGGAVRVAAAPGTGTVVVHVAGAVHRPGVYRLRSGSRVQAAIRRAGGAKHGADLDALNLAAKLEDGRQVLVPLRAAVADAAGAVDAAGGSSASGPGPPLNLNTATVAQLDELDGVGPVMAQKIVDYRQEHGGFGSVDELDQVPGIGPTRLAALREAVTA
jgi:competence protein ComEA